jgi:hypothetical protein
LFCFVDSSSSSSSSSFVHLCSENEMVNNGCNITIKTKSQWVVGVSCVSSPPYDIFL